MTDTVIETFTDATRSNKSSRAIYTDADLDKFKASDTYKELTQFIRLCGESVEGKSISSEASNGDPSMVVQLVSEFFTHLMVLIDEIPPIKQPMRFGNKAFRLFHAALLERTPAFVETLLSTAATSADLLAYKEELGAYLCDAFGNNLRIDYGTGHETNIAIFFLCLFKLRLVSEADLSKLVSLAFARYIQVMRKLQSVYFLEPAGSHGVWGLDDYHCLIYVWGSSQLIQHPEIRPRDILDSQLVSSEAPDYLYLEGIQTIQRVKNTAPFHETSPMLHSISELSDWRAVKNGLLKLYQGEVLNKLPVVQHLLFGQLFRATWTASLLTSAANVHPPNPNAPTIGITQTQSQSQSAYRVPSLPSSNNPFLDDMSTKAPWAKK